MRHVTDSIGVRRVARFATVAVLAAGAAGASAQPAPPAGPPPQRPSFELPTSERYEAAGVAPYRGRHTDIYAYIDAHQTQHLEHLRRWVRQPSVSAQNIGIAEMAVMVRDDLRAIGFQEAELVPTSGHPGVWGYYDAGADTTLVVYLMYDVQPVEDEAWRVEPFDGALVDHPLGRVLMARGATNQKGPERAFLNAVESIVRVTGGLPVNLMIAAEGEEELGSPNYPEVIARYEDRLRQADGVFFPFNSQGQGGEVSMFLGVKGILYFELEATGGAAGGPARAEIHGSLKAIVDSPAWRLVQALASLTTPDGNTIAVPGYYDALRQPTHAEARLINALADRWHARETQMRKALGVERWIDGMEGTDALLEQLYSTTLNINGIWSGYTGPGTKTILPHKATAKVDSRLVPNQTPDEALALIRRHLDDRGYGDLEIRQLGGYPPAQTPVDTPLVQAAIGVYNKYGRTPSIAPRLAGSAPYYIFTDRLKLPLVAGGLGHGSGAHAPDEYMVIEPRPGSGIAGLADIEKFYVDLLFALANVR